jgi:hypothetical protein
MVFQSLMPRIPSGEVSAYVAGSAFIGRMNFGKVSAYYHFHRERFAFVPEVTIDGIGNLQFDTISAYVQKPGSDLV